MRWYSRNISKSNFPKAVKTWEEIQRKNENLAKIKECRELVADIRKIARSMY